MSLEQVCDETQCFSHEMTTVLTTTRSEARMKQRPKTRQCDDIKCQMATEILPKTTVFLERYGSIPGAVETEKKEAKF